MTEQTRNTLLLITVALLTVVTLGLVAAIQLQGRQPDEMVWMLLTYMLGVISTMVGGVVPTNRGGGGLGAGPRGAVPNQDLPAGAGRLHYVANVTTGADLVAVPDDTQPEVHDDDLADAAEVAAIEAATLAPYKLEPGDDRELVGSRS